MVSNARTRVQIMQKLQRDNELGIKAAPPRVSPPAPVSPTTCVLLTNMFDPTKETDPNFHLEVSNLGQY